MDVQDLGTSSATTAGVSRREFLAGAGTAAGTLLTLGATAGLVAVPGVAQAALARTYAASHLVLEMNGIPVGDLMAVQGGGPLLELLPAGKAVGATGLALSYQPVQVAFGSSMSKPFYDWMTRSIAAPLKGLINDVSIVAYDVNFLEVYRLLLKGVRLTAFEVPALQAASTDRLRLNATLVAESATNQLPKGAIQGKSVVGVKAKNAIARNFALAIAGLESATRLAVAVGGIGLRLAEQAVDPRLRGPWTIEPIELEVPFSAAAPLYQWLDATLAGKDGEHPGVLQFLAVDGIGVLASIDMPRLGIASVSAPSLDASTGTLRTVVQLYCRDVQANFAGMTA